MQHTLQKRKKKETNVIPNGVSVYHLILFNYTLFMTHTLNKKKKKKKKKKSNVIPNGVSVYPNC